MIKRENKLKKINKSIPVIFTDPKFTRKWIIFKKKKIKKKIDQY